MSAKRSLRLVALLALLLAASCSTTVLTNHAQPDAQAQAGSHAAPQSAVASDAAAGPVLAGAEAAGRPEVEPLLETSKTITGEDIDYPRGALPLVVAQIVTIGPGQTTGWHRHEVPGFGYLLSGQIEVEYEGAGRRTLSRGDRLVESTKHSHIATNLGTEPARILVVFMSAHGKHTVMKADPPAMPAALSRGRHSDLVELPSVDPRIRLDLRYASAGNFTGHPVYPSAHAFLQRPAALALKRANDRAHELGYGLMVFDAYRPWSVTRMFWDGFPMHRAYLADPLEGSRHNRGCAVDLTLVDLASGSEVHMPSGYDDFSERAHPAYKGGTDAERASRDKLRRIMEAEGFSVYENEWWHFDYKGWQDYPVLDATFEQLARQQVSVR